LNSKYSIIKPVENFAKKCRICGAITISMPLQILHTDGSSLCSQCSEMHSPVLHDVLHEYLTKYPHYLQALCTQNKQNYSLILSYNQKPADEFNYRCTLGTDLCHLADHHNILSFYYFPQSPSHALAKIKVKDTVKDNAPDIPAEEMDYINKSFLRVYGPDVINMFFMIDKSILSFDNEWRFLSPDGRLDF